MSLLNQDQNSNLITQAVLERYWNEGNLAEYTRKFSLYDWILNQGNDGVCLIYVTRKQVLIITGPQRFIDKYGQEEKLGHSLLEGMVAKRTGTEGIYPAIEIRCENQRHGFCCPLAFEDTIECTDKMKAIVSELAIQVGHINEEEKRKGYFERIEPFKKASRVKAEMLKTPRSEDDSNEVICGVSLDEFLRILKEQNLKLEKAENDTAQGSGVFNFITRLLGMGKSGNER